MNYQDVIVHSMLWKQHRFSQYCLIVFTCGPKDWDWLAVLLLILFYWNTWQIDEEKGGIFSLSMSSRLGEFDKGNEKKQAAAKKGCQKNYLLARLALLQTHVNSTTRELWAWFMICDRVNIKFTVKWPGLTKFFSNNLYSQLTITLSHLSLDCQSIISLNYNHKMFSHWPNW